MKTRKEKRFAIVVLPAAGGGGAGSGDIRRWLSKGKLSMVQPSTEWLHTVLKLLGLSAPGEGLAALRFWGQTGERSAAWMAAADPVHLEARLDHLRLYSLQGRVAMSELRLLFDQLQKSLGSGDIAFARIGMDTYVRGSNEIASAGASSILIDGLPPDDYMPQGVQAESHHRLVSEVQMVLHDHEVNLQREQAGDRTFNSIWIWGGGYAPEVSVQPIVPLFANDALFRGYWLSRTGLVEPWSDDFASFTNIVTRGFVAVAPETVGDGSPDRLDTYLRQLKRMLDKKDICHLTMLFRDGLRVEISAMDRYRFWRKQSSLLAAT